ncbi:hypothetical protein X772_32075 [Mesorhizobium sp. LSJC280B00]|nr:hypothetical protein X772_32075 [Mesorhizobium sp. LSJC280B00]
MRARYMLRETIGQKSAGRVIKLRASALTGSATKEHDGLSGPFWIFVLTRCV